MNSLSDEGETKVSDLVNVNQDQKVLFLSTQDQISLVSIRSNILKVFELRTSWTQGTTMDLPRTKHEQLDKLYLYELLPSNEIIIGANTSLAVKRTGFYPIEKNTDGTLFRWTEKNALLKTSVHAELLQELQITLLHTGPPGRKLSIEVEGKIVYQGLTDDNIRNLKIPLDIIRSSDSLSISIQSETWSPADSGSADTRDLGVAIGEISFR